MRISNITTQIFGFFFTNATHIFTIIRSKKLNIPELKLFIFQDINAIRYIYFF